MSHSSRLAWIIVLTVALTGLFSQGAFAQGDKAHIAYRQKIMKSIVANIGGIGDILKKKVPHVGNLAGHAANIQRNAEMIPSAFDKKVTAGKTDAKAAIWQNWSEFRDKAEKLSKAAGAMVKAAESGNPEAIGAAIKGLGGACKGCHKEFRKPKEESWKRKK